MGCLAGVQTRHSPGSGKSLLPPSPPPTTPKVFSFSPRFRWRAGRDPLKWVYKLSHRMRLKSRPESGFDPLISSDFAPQRILGNDLAPEVRIARHKSRSRHFFPRFPRQGEKVPWWGNCSCQVTPQASLPVRDIERNFLFRRTRHARARHFHFPPLPSKREQLHREKRAARDHRKKSNPIARIDYSPGVPPLPLPLVSSSLVRRYLYQEGRFKGKQDH